MLFTNSVVSFDLSIWTVFPYIIRALFEFSKILLIFNPAQQSASIFGGSAVSSPTTGGSMFGGTASFGSPSPQQPQFGSSTFGGGSTAFGSQAASPFGGSLFGGGSTV